MYRLWMTYMLTKYRSSTKEGVLFVFFICLSPCLTPPPTLCLSVSQPFSYPPLSQYFFLAPCLSNSPSPSACLCNINSFSLSRSVCLSVSHSLCSCFYLFLCYSFSFSNNLTYPYITSTDELLKYTVWRLFALDYTYITTWPWAQRTICHVTPCLPTGCACAAQSAGWCTMLPLPIKEMVTKVTERIKEACLVLGLRVEAQQTMLQPASLPIPPFICSTPTHPTPQPLISRPPAITRVPVASNAALLLSLQ